MPNNHVIDRLAGIQQILNGVHAASSSMSAASRGHERQAFIDSFLANVLPPVYRFGTGDATDTAGNRSGQLDVVVEYPFSPTLPSAGGAGATRLYLAEGVAAVIEVKSNAMNQWGEAVRTANVLAPLTRNFSAAMVFGASGRPPTTIPLFVVGYTGWRTADTMKAQLAANPNVAGILIIDAGLFVTNQVYGSMVATGPVSLWGLIVALHRITNSLANASTNPVAYVV
jgi:hypothetical protein